MRRFICLFFALVLTASTASARVRLWENNKDNPEKLQYLELGGFLQPGLIFRQKDDNANAPSDTTFLLQRARINLRAQLHSMFAVQMELETTPGAALQDAFVEFNLHKSFNIRAGQFLVPFLRTFLYNESNLSFIDRLVYTPLGEDRKYLRFLSPRDIGAMVTGRLGDTSAGAVSPVVEYWAGVFVGRGANQVRNEDDAFLYSVRAQVHLMGLPDGLGQESDLARNKTPRLSLAGGGYSNCDDRRGWNRGFTSDAEFRYQGLFATATFVWFRTGAIRSPAFGYDQCGVGNGQDPDYISKGASTQVQYVLPPSVFGNGHQALEFGARWDYVDPNSSTSSFFGGGPGTKGYVPPTNFNSPDNSPSRWRLTTGVNWFPTNQQTLRLSLNYQLNRETETVTKNDGNYSAIKNDVVWVQMTAAL
jgi:hypothetical protein